jgi:hypothetical protein
MKSKNQETNKFEINGQVLVRIDVVPADYAEKNPVGKARAEPNKEPKLPEPEGRIELTINPFKMFNQMVGPAVRRKVYGFLCFMILCVLCVGIGPTILANILARLMYRMVDVW